MKDYIMLDLETFATSNNALIVSIGAVKFNVKKKLDFFYNNIKFDEYSSLFDIDPNTVCWWLQQTENARAALIRKDYSLPLKKVLIDLNSFIKGTSGVFGNGSTFDNVILRNAYNKLGLMPSWSFRHDKCYRTIKQMYPSIEIEEVGEHHNALDDAKTQTNHLLKLYNIHKFIL